MSTDSKPRSSWQPPSLAELQALVPGYEFHALIGRGGMGAVFKATQRSLNRPIAIKILPANLLEEVEANFAARFRQESLTMAKLTHPGIVSVFESGESGGMLYIVMEFVDGTDVARMIASEGKLAPELATKVLTQVCEALRYAHERGVIHRDIKPANLLLTRDGTVKIADFGLAKHHDDALLGLTKTNLAIGTPDFLAPEAWTPGTTLDERADLYAVGVTLYQMLTGKMPRGLWIMPSERFGTDPRFDAIIERALQPEPEARYQSSAELRRDLEKIQTEPQSAEQRAAPVAAVPAPSGIWIGGSRLRRIAAVLIVFAILLAAVIVAIWPRTPKPNSTPLAGTATNVPVAATSETPPATGAATSKPPSVAVTPVSVRPTASSPESTIRELAHWLVREGATFEFRSAGGIGLAKRESEIPEGDFQIYNLAFTPRWSETGESMQKLLALTTLESFLNQSEVVTDEDVAFLADNPRLSRVFLEASPRHTDAVLGHIAGLKQLEGFQLSYARRVTGRNFAGAPWLSTIKGGQFYGLPQLEDAALEALGTCTQLERLELYGSPRLTHEGLRALLRVRTLRELLVAHCAGLTDAGLAEVLPGFHQLKQLNLNGTQFGDEAAAATATLTNLYSLTLFDTKLTDEGLAKLTALPRLRKLDFRNTRVTPEGRAAIEKALPNCAVER